MNPNSQYIPQGALFKIVKSKFDSDFWEVNERKKEEGGTNQTRAGGRARVCVCVWKRSGRHSLGCNFQVRFALRGEQLLKSVRWIISESYFIIKKLKHVEAPCSTGEQANKRERNDLR